VHHDIPIPPNRFGEGGDRIGGARIGDMSDRVQDRVGARSPIQHGDGGAGLVEVAHRVRADEARAADRENVHRPPLRRVALSCRLVSCMSASSQSVARMALSGLI